MKPKKYKEIQFPPAAPDLKEKLCDRLNDLFPNGGRAPGHLAFRPMSRLEYNRRDYREKSHQCRYDVSFHLADGRLIEEAYKAPNQKAFHEKAMSNVTGINWAQRKAVDWTLTLRAHQLYHGYHAFAGDVDPREGILKCGRWVLVRKMPGRDGGMPVRGIPMVRHGFEPYLGQKSIFGGFLHGKDRLRFKTDHPSSVLLNVSDKK